MALAPRILAAAGLLAVPALLAVASQSLARPADIPPVEQQTVVVDLAPAGGTTQDAAAPTTEPTTESTAEPTTEPSGPPAPPTSSGAPSNAPTTEPAPSSGAVPAPASEAPAPAPAPSIPAPAPAPAPFIPAPREPGLVEREVLDDGFDDASDDIDGPDEVDADVDTGSGTDGDD